MRQKNIQWMCRCLLELFLLAVFLLTACGETTQASWQEQYDLGIKYLSEGNYEEAIIAFTAAIEIDPKRPEAYLKAAEAYRAVGDIENAYAILERGYAETGDQTIFAAMEELSKDDVRDPEMQSTADADSWALETFIMPEELTIGGTLFYDATIEGAQQAYPGGLVEKTTMGELYTYQNLVYHELSGGIGGYGTYVTIGNDTSFRIEGEPYEPYEVVEPEFRDIRIGDTLDEVLEKLGISQEGIDYIQSSLRSMESGAVDLPVSMEQDEISSPSVIWSPSADSYIDACVMIEWNTAENFRIQLTIWIENGTTRMISMDYRSEAENKVEGTLE